jgi:hypothetical protein
MSKYNSHEQLKRVRKRLSEMGLNKKRKFVHLTCNKCKKLTDIRVNNPDIYTEELRKTWVCYLCSSGGKKPKI